MTPTKDKAAPDFIMQQQQEDNWCWAAVAASIHQFLDPNSPKAWTQGAIATPVLVEEQQIKKTIDCSKNPDQCDFPANLEDALSTTDNLHPEGVLANQHLIFDSLKKWIDAKLPVCARITWFDGGAHFIVLDGYRVLSNGDQQVHVQDPYWGPSFQDYNGLVADYPPGGNWQDTYLVKK